MLKKYNKLKPNSSQSLRRLMS